MTDKRTDQLPEAAALDGNEIVAIDQAGNSRQAALGDIVGIQHDHAIADVAGLAAALANLSTYILPFEFTTSPTASEVLRIHVAGAPITIPANFAGALRSHVGVNPTATFAIDVQLNGVSVGTISISVAGAVTAATVGGEAIEVAAGDLITVVAPGAADATAANMSFTIIGDR